SVQVVLELCMPVLAIMGLYSFFKSDKEHQWKSLWKSSAVVVGLLAFLFIIKGFFSFSGGADSQLMQMFNQQTEDPNFGTEFIKALKADRESMYVSDLLRSGFFILSVAGILWMFIKDKLAQTTAVVLVGVLMVGDLILIDKNY